MRNYVSFRVGASIVAAVVLSLAVYGFTYASHSWGGYHWARGVNPFNVNLGDNVSSAWDAHLVASSVDWSLSKILDAQKVAGANLKNCKPVAGRVEVCDKKYGFNGWLGAASIWVSGDHITQGTVKLNDTYFNTKTYNTPAWRKSVMCQEIGHTFGLDHQDENFTNANLGTCMDYTNDPARNDGLGTNLQPNAHDYEQLEAIYAHLEPSSTSAFSNASSANADDLEHPSQWGKVVKKSADGRPSLYVRDFGRGHKVFTFVIWAK